jgi:hypothetical protein
MRRKTIIWLALALVTLMSMGAATMRLQGLPKLPVTVGPDLKVRSVRAQGSANEAVVLQRGDRLTSLEGGSVQDLMDVRTSLFMATPPAGNAREVEYQIVRPLYRFNLMLSGEQVDPTGLPPGVEDGDMLVELDGRPMKPKVGTEGLRSIISSRPEALLVLERRDAVFTGQLELPYEHTAAVPLAVFVIVLVLIGLIWRLRDPSLVDWTPLGVGAETLAFGWCALIAIQYQWIISDPVLTTIAAVALILVRPLGTSARAASADATTQPGTYLVLGVLGAAVVSGLLYGGMIPDAEAALQLSAILSILFIIFEIAMTSLGEGAGMTLGERSVYLAGTVLLTLVAAGLALLVEPTEFHEERWRWFTSILLALVWFGDVMLCFRGLPSTAFAEIATSEWRRDTIAMYLEELAEEFPGTTLSLVMYREESSRVFRMEESGLELEQDAEALHEAVAIMLQERTHVPSMDRDTDPLAGIAESMGIALALAFTPPDEAPRMDGTELAIVGFVADEEAPPEPLSLEDLDFIQSRMSPLVWAATLFEGMALTIMDGVAAAPSPAEPDEGEGAEEAEDLAERVGALEEELAEARSEEEMLRADRLALAAEAQLLRRWHAPPAALPPEATQMMEPELVDALTYLLESPEPLVIAGAPGVGKTFTAAVAHELDGSPRGPATVYDASLYADDAQMPNLLGTEDAQGVLAACEGGALIVEHAHLLSPPMLTDLIAEAAESRARLYLCFTDPQAEARSVLDAMPDALLDQLEHRELVIPSLARRGILEGVLYVFFDQAVFTRGRNVRDISPAAMRALLGYDYPGNMREAKAIMDALVARARGEIIELGDLPSDLRRASF